MIGPALVLLQFLLILAFALFPGRPWPWSTPAWPGLVLAALGLPVFLLGLKALGRNLTPLPAPKAGCALVRDGVYRWVRHPLYSGGLLSALGVALATRSLPRVGWWALLALLLDHKARYEEGLLSRRFPEYDGYVRRSKRFLPGIY